MLLLHGFSNYRCRSTVCCLLFWLGCSGPIVLLQDVSKWRKISFYNKYKKEIKKNGVRGSCMAVWTFFLFFLTHLVAVLCSGEWGVSSFCPFRFTEHHETFILSLLLYEQQKSKFLHLFDKNLTPNDRTFPPLKLIQSAACGVCLQKIKTNSCSHKHWR